VRGFEFEAPPHPYVHPDELGRPTAARKPERNGGPPPVSLGDLLDAIQGFIRHYVVMTEAQAVAATLWTALTHIYDGFELVPYLSVTSAEKRSGKSRLLDVLALLVARPWKAVMPTEAVVYRKIEADRPTLLLDEVDAIFGSGPAAAQHEGLRALLNAGNRRGTRVPRCVGASFSLVEFSVYCPKVLAGIGSLPETVADRAIPIRMRRKAPGELEARFREREAPVQAAPIAAALSAWASEAVDALSEARPDLPHELNDRAQDAWEPLLAIADAAGGTWSKHARQSAVELAENEEAEAMSYGIRALADIRAAFEDARAEAIFSSDLIVTLCADEEAPWATHKNGGLNPMGLATLLRPYGIKPELIRQGETVARGYRRADFEDVWPRYLPSDRSSRKPVTSEAAKDPLRHSHAGMRHVTGVAAVTGSEGGTEHGDKADGDELAWR
jgi:Protein of unknown function (DUF3631)